LRHPCTINVPTFGVVPAWAAGKYAALSADRSLKLDAHYEPTGGGGSAGRAAEWSPALLTARGARRCPLASSPASL
jgi:hypothetical protein